MRQTGLYFGGRLHSQISPSHQIAVQQGPAHALRDDPAVASAPGGPASEYGTLCQGAGAHEGAAAAVAR